MADFKKLNKAIERPTWLTESSSQLLRHINCEVRYFVSLDLTSGYHHIRIDSESQDILCITTLMGRYKYTVMGQGITSACDIFNFLTDDDLRINRVNSIKNMDNLFLYSETLEDQRKIRLD